MSNLQLRGILNYVPRFREGTFVISLDSVILTSPTFQNIFLDLSVLLSLRINIVLVHGASVQINQLAKERGLTPSCTDGMGATDEATLTLATMASSHLSIKILQCLSDNDIRGVVPNAIVAHPRGIIHGKDQAYTGKVEKVDAALLQKMLLDDVIPVLPPLGFDGEGKIYRVNSDSVAMAVATALGAQKLIYLTTCNGVMRNGKYITQMSVAEARDYLKANRAELSPNLQSKLECGIRACETGVKRAHILDGTQDEVLLKEIFSNDGVGTMIHANEYTSIRKARKRDARAILNLLSRGMESEELIPRTHNDIANKIDRFFVFEIDRNVVGCVCVELIGDNPRTVELGCLYVSGEHENQGIGHKLMLYAEEQARKLGALHLVALSTQTFNYFQNKGGFSQGTLDMLPEARKAAYLSNGRNSKILVKKLD